MRRYASATIGVLELVGADVRAKGPDGELLIELPEIEVGISLRALLRRGMLAPVSLAARGAAPGARPQRRTAAFGLRGLPATGRPAAPRGEIALEALLEPLLSADPDEPLSYLRASSTSSGGQLVLEDRVTDHTILARDAELTARRTADGLAGELAFDLDQAGEPATVLADGQPRRRDRPDQLRARLRRPVAAELVRIEPALPLQGVDLTLAGRVTGDATLQGDRSPLEFELQVGERRDRAARPAGRPAADRLGEHERRDRRRSRRGHGPPRPGSSTRTRPSACRPRRRGARPACRCAPRSRRSNVAARDLELLLAAGGRPARRANG